VSSDTVAFRVSSHPIASSGGAGCDATAGVVDQYPCPYPCPRVVVITGRQARVSAGRSQSRPPGRLPGGDRGAVDCPVASGACVLRSTRSVDVEYADHARPLGVWGRVPARRRHRSASGCVAAGHGLDVSAITAQVQSVQRAQVALRTNDPADARVWSLDLTGTGRGILQALRTTAADTGPFAEELDRGRSDSPWARCSRNSTTHGTGHPPGETLVDDCPSPMGRRTMIGRAGTLGPRRGVVPNGDVDILAAGPATPAWQVPWTTFTRNLRGGRDLRPPHLPM
jgi:hypothetical protein